MKNAETSLLSRQTKRNLKKKLQIGTKNPYSALRKLAYMKALDKIKSVQMSCSVAGDFRQAPKAVENQKSLMKIAPLRSLIIEAFAARLSRIPHDPSGESA